MNPHRKRGRPITNWMDVVDGLDRDKKIMGLERKMKDDDGEQPSMTIAAPQMTGQAGGGGGGGRRC